MTAPVPTPNWCHPATVLAVKDGDTVLVRLDLGKYPHRIETAVPIRLAGLYAPERSTEPGEAAREYLHDLLFDGFEGAAVIVQTRKPNPRDKYGRVVADVWCVGMSVAEEMIRAGHGKGQP